MTPSAPTQTLFPTLRQDLVLSQALSEANRPPMFVLADLVRHKFFHLGQAELQELSQANPSAGDASPLVQFLLQNELTVQSEKGTSKKFSEKAKRAKQGILNQALHGYLFFRIPLLNPVPLQRRLWPIVTLLFSRVFILATVLAGIFGLFFMSRHWQEFASGFAGMFTVSGFTTYALAFAFIKLLHEAGHAFMAYRFGIQVPTVGIAFMMFAPVLYTETSSAWHLAKRERMLIGAAGMIVEIIIAVWALLLWVFVPDGTTRSILFAITTTGWFLTLAVNLNPLMRFDGYFLASDFVSVPNLQDRSFAIARWGIRALLFAPNEPKPEDFSRAKTIGLFAFAIATWIYRLFLYIGIALLVYHFTVKLLGIFLFIVEVWWFIALPFWREGRHWWNNRKTYFSTPTSKRTMLGFVFIMALLFVPLTRTISLPALLTSDRFEQIHTKADAIIVRSHLFEGRQVSRGDILIELEMPDISFQLAKAHASIRMANTKLTRLAADAESRSQRQIIEQEMARALQTLDGLKKLQEQQRVRAPFSGIVVNVEPALTAKRWIGPSTTLAVIKSVQGSEIHALATDMQVIRIANAASAKFLPDDFSLLTLDANLIEIDDTGSASLPYPDLADIHGGTVATMANKKDDLMPTTTYAKLRLAPINQKHLVARVQRGVVHVRATGESIATKTLRRVASILIMESGF